MTYIKVPKKERDAVAFCLVSCNIEHRFLTMENNDQMVLCEIACDDAAVMYHVGRAVSYQRELPSDDLLNMFKIDF